MANSTKRFWLVRHGQTPWNAQKRIMGLSDIPLSAKGRVQARWAARQLRFREIEGDRRHLCQRPGAGTRDSPYHRYTQNVANDR